MDENSQEPNKKLTKAVDDPLNNPSVPDNGKKEWVKFDDEENVKSDVQNEKVENLLLLAPNCSLK